MIDQQMRAALALAERWSRLSRKERVVEFHSLPRGEQDDFFLHLRASEQAELLLGLPENERRLWLRLPHPDDTADLLQHVDPRQRQALLQWLDDSNRNEVTALLAFREDEAGGLMSPRFARLRPEASVDEALSYLRKQAGYLETIDTAYVLDQEQHLIGVVTLIELFAAESQKLVRDVMHTEFVSVATDMDQEQVARMVRGTHLPAVPVLDAQKCMQGIVTLDDVVDVIDEEAGEDIQKLGGMEALDEPYLEIGLLRLLWKRAGWLVVLFLGEMLTATAMSHYEDQIAQAVVLALFLPLIISSGGNAGSQATTLVIRAMALSEIKLRDWYRVVRRELLGGLALGCILGVIGIARVVAWEALFGSYGAHYVFLALTIGLSLVGVVLFGSLSGSMLPFILRRCGLDPASASAPFVATLVDVTGLIIYFTVAKIVLQGTLL